MKYAQRKVTIRTRGTNAPWPKEVTVGDVEALARAIIAPYIGTPYNAPSLSFGRLLKDVIRDTLGTYGALDRKEELKELHPAQAWAIVVGSAELLRLRTLGIEDFKAAAEAWQEASRKNFPGYPELYRLELPTEGYPAGYCSILDRPLEEIVYAMKFSSFDEPEPTLEVHVPYSREKETIDNPAYLEMREAIEEATPRDAATCVRRLEENGHRVRDWSELGRVYIRDSSHWTSDGEDHKFKPDSLEGWLDLYAILDADEAKVKALPDEPTSDEFLEVIADKVTVDPEDADRLIIKKGVFYYSTDEHDCQDIDDLEDELQEACRKADIELDAEIMEYRVIGDREQWLKGAGEIVFDFGNLTVWGRQGTGQAFKCDSTFSDIGLQNELLPGLAHSWNDAAAKARKRLGIELISHHSRLADASHAELMKPAKPKSDGK